MTGFGGINLKDMISEIGEKEVKSILSDFSCPLNADVEHFLKHTAIEFAKQGIASTYLIMASYQNKYVLVGYFSLANKIFCIDRDSFPTKHGGDVSPNLANMTQRLSVTPCLHRSSGSSGKILHITTTN